MDRNERTLAIIKPDAVRNKYVGRIIETIEHNCMDIKIVDIRHLWYGDSIGPINWTVFYKQHVGKPFFDGLIRHMSSAPSVAMILEGEDVIQKWRNWIGPTDPREGDWHHHLRARYGIGLPENSLHASDSPEAAEREIDLLFNPEEFLHQIQEPAK